MQMWVVNGIETNRNETKANCKCGTTLATVNCGIANLLAALRLQFMLLPCTVAQRRFQCLASSRNTCANLWATKHGLSNPFA